MPKFNPATALDALEIEQLVTEWCRELDENHGLDAVRFFTEDCIVEAGLIVYTGHEAMRQ